MKVTYIKTGKRVKPKSENKHFVTNGSRPKQSENQHKTKQEKNVKKVEFNKNEVFKTIFRKNQIVLLTLALMLVTAGYMNYNNGNNELNLTLAELGDAQLVSTNVTSDNETVDTSANETDQENNMVGVAENVVNTTETNVATDTSNNVVESSNNGENATIVTNNNEEVSNNVEVNANQDYYTQTRLDRQTMYSQMLDAYQKILENEKIPADQKSVAANEIKNINDRINAISIIENLIKTKGFEDVVLLINDNNINVVIKQKDKLSDEQVAQITNIVSRELNAEIEDIHITMQQ